MEWGNLFKSYELFSKSRRNVWAVVRIVKYIWSNEIRNRDVFVYLNPSSARDGNAIFASFVRRYLHNNGVKWCKVAWRNNSAHTDSYKLYLWLRSTAAVSGAQRPRPHRILRVSEGPSILAWPTLNMVKNYRGRIWSEATKDCPDFLGFLRAHRY